MAFLDVILPTIGTNLFPLMRRPRPLPEDSLDHYQKSTRQEEWPYLCNAPFNNMYFSVTGLVGACWLTNSPFIADKWSPSRSIRDIWFGESFERLRREIRENNLHTFCNVCEQNIREKRRPLATVYDRPHPLGDYPRMMELELSNLCNLECVMCTGLLSSAIRENREKKAPLVSPYNDQFVQELDEFIPHLREVRFSGGEPTRHRIMFKILERIEKLNPRDLRVNVTTNATTFAPPLARWFDRVNFNMGVSIDSLTKEIYEKIRVNARFEKVLANVEEMCAVSARHGRAVSMQMNPMRMNWHELPNFVRFCNQRGIWLNFNTVQHPKEVALWTMPKPELQRIYEQLAGEEFDVDESRDYQRHNLASYRGVVEGQIRSWAEGAKEVIKL